MNREEAEELCEVIQMDEPGLVVECSKRWFSRSFRVFVVRDGQRQEYQSVSHYWFVGHGLKRARVKAFCDPLDDW